MQTEEQSKQWFVLRDFKKWNAKTPAYKLLPQLGIQCFTPMHWIVTTRRGVRRREYVPFIQNLLFAYDTRDVLDPIIAKEQSLQYQFQRGKGSATPMTVPEADMTRFITAVNNDPSPIYYTLDEITPDMYGRRIVIDGGPLNGYEGILLKRQGSKKKRILVEIPHLLTAAVEVSPTYLHFL